MKTKNPPPSKFVHPRTPLLKVLVEFLQLKNLYRQGWLKREVPEDKCESVADHTMGVTLLSLFLVENYFPEADLLKTLRMALTHEAGEVYAGDITPVDGVSLEEKHLREEESATRVFDGLPQEEEYLSIWQEFEESKTLEARIVRQADRLEMILQTCYYEKLNYHNFEEFFRNTAPLMKDPRFQKLFSEIESLR